MRTLGLCVLFIAGIGFANWITTRSWDGVVYVYVGERRAPASVRTVHDYSAIDRRALYRSVHAQLMASAQLTKHQGLIGVRLGHPLVARPEGGGKEFACEIAGHTGVYDRMELTFYGTGITDNGEAPHLVVDTECLATGQPDTLDTVWIPMQEIIATGAKDQELQTDGDHPMMIKLEHIPDAWPENWVLWSVRFYRSDNEEENLTVDASHLKEAVSPLISFDWKITQ